MPTIRVEMFEGRTPEQKKNLVKALTQAVVETLDTRPEAVDVILYDVKKSEWATGGPALVGENLGVRTARVTACQRRLARRSGSMFSREGS